MRSLPFLFVIVLSLAGSAQATTFVSSISFAAGTSAHVTVYDVNGNPQNPATSPVTWPATLPAGMTVAVDATGYIFSDPNVLGPTNLIATQGVATGTLTVTVTAPPLKFSSP